MVITGMKVYRVVTIVATIILAIALVAEVFGDRRIAMITSYGLILAANLLIYTQTTRKNKQK